MKDLIMVDAATEIEKAHFIVVGDNNKWYYTSVNPETVGEVINHCSQIKEFHYGEFLELLIYKLADKEPFILK